MSKSTTLLTILLKIAEVSVIPFVFYGAACHPLCYTASVYCRSLYMKQVPGYCCLYARRKNVFVYFYCTANVMITQLSC